MRILERRDLGVSERESLLEDFVYDALARFKVPLPVTQYRIVIGGRERRIDFCYPDRMIALEAQGYEMHGRRERFDADALRGNELLLAGFRVLQFTSAFTDRLIATQVASALGCEVCGGAPARTFADWTAHRDCLD
jgi:very-short-patch-repair endonuclease